MAIRQASAQWNGTLREGSGSIQVESKTFDAPFGFKSRFENGPGTNPEELIAAAHAGCFTMATTAALTTARAGALTATGAAALPGIPAATGGLSSGPRSARAAKSSVLTLWGRVSC